MSDITKRYGIITGGTGSFGSVQHTDGSDTGTRVEIFDSSKNLKNITSVSASGDVQGATGTFATGSFGGDVSVGGNLTVNGTTTSVNSTSIELGDRIINLNSSNAAGDAGFYVNDTATDQTGSMLWDSSTDRWMAGLSGSEVILVDRSSTETLTNKTLTSPVISSGDINSPDIDGGTIDGATIATSDVTVGASKTLDVSAGTLTTSAAQKLAIMQGAGANVDIGAYDLRASTLTADSMTSGRVAIYGANGVLADDSDLSFSGDTLTATKLGAFEAAGAINFANQDMTNVDIDSGAIDGTVIGAASAAAGTFAALAGTTVSASVGVFAPHARLSGSTGIIKVYDTSKGDGTYVNLLSLDDGNAAIVFENDLGYSVKSAGGFDDGSATLNGGQLASTAGNIVISNASDAGSNLEIEKNSRTDSVEFKSIDSAGLKLTDYESGASVMTIVSSSAGGSSINMYTGSISNLQDPSSAQDAATKAYVDAQVTAQDLDFQGDVGGALNIDLDSETLDIAGGTNISTSGSGNTLTVNLDSALSSLTSVDGSGDLTMGTITMTGFSVDADGDTSAKSLTSTSTISGSGALSAGSMSTTGLATLAAVKVTGGPLWFQSGATHEIQNANGDSNIVLDSDDGDVAIGGDLRVNGNDIKGSDGVAAITLEGDGTGIIVNDLQSVGTISAAAVSGSGAAQFASLHCDSVNLDGGAIDGTVIGASSVAAGSFAALAGTTGTFSGVLKSDDTTEATSTTDGSLQTDGGLSVAKSAVVGDDLDLLSDAAILNFGADKDVNLTHVADAGLLLNSAMKLQFRDSTEFVHSDADGYMHMEGATGVNLAINGSDVLAVSSAKVSSKQDHEFLGSMKFGMGSDHYINNKMGSNNFLLDSTSAGVTAGSWFKVTGDLTVTGNDIKDASNSAAITFDGAGNTDINGTLAASGHITLDNTKDLLAGGADCEIGSNSQKFAAGYFTNVYTGDMHLKNERGDWTIFEESDHLRIRNNLTGQTFKMGMTLIDDQ